MQDRLYTSASQTTLKQLLEMSPIAVRIAKAKGSEVVFANLAYAKLIGSEVSSVIGKNPRDYYADKTEYDAIVAQIEAKETIYDKLIELYIGGKTLWSLCSYMSIEFEGEECVLGWFYDVTKEKKALQSIEQISQDLKREKIFLQGQPNSNIKSIQI